MADVLIRTDNLEAQYKHMQFLRRLTAQKLRRYHKEVFAKLPDGHRWKIEIPKWLPRHYVERRCWYYFAYHHYHLDGNFRKQFRNDADHYLSMEYPQEDANILLQLNRELRELRSSDLAQIMQWEEDRIDQYLLTLGYVLSAPVNTKRIMLHELLDSQAGDLIPQGNLTTGKIVVRRVNRFVLADIIRRYPTLTWRRFQARFGADMPSVNLRSFNDTKSRIRKELGVKRVPYIREDLVDGAHEDRDRHAGAKTVAVRKRNSDDE